MNRNTAWAMIGALLAVCLILSMLLILTFAEMHKSEIVSLVSAVKEIRVSVDSTDEGFSVEITNKEPTFAEKVQDTLDSLTDIWSEPE